MNEFCRVLTFSKCTGSRPLTSSFNTTEVCHLTMSLYFSLVNDHMCLCTYVESSTLICVFVLT